MNSDLSQNNTVEKYSINTLEKVFIDFPGQLTGYVENEDWKKLSVDDKKQLLYSFGIDVNSYVEFKIKQLGIQAENKSNIQLPTEVSKDEVKPVPLPQTDIVQPQQTIAQEQVIKVSDILKTEEISNKDEELKEGEKNVTVETSKLEKIEIPEIDHYKYTKSQKVGVKELTQEEKERIDVETAKKANTSSGPTVSFHGYQPSDNFMTSVRSYSSGSTKNGSTWLALLFRKVKDMMLSA